MILNRTVLKELITELQNPFQNKELSKEIKALFLFLNSSIFKEKLAKKHPVDKISIKQKDLKEIILPKLSEEDISFFAKFYDYIFYTVNEKEQLIEYFDNSHIAYRFLEFIDFLVLEYLHSEEMYSVETSKLSFREHFDESVVKYDLFKKDKMEKEDGYIKEMNDNNYKELIIKMFNKRSEAHDKVRNNMILVEIDMKKFILDIDFFKYKYTKFK